MGGCASRPKDLKGETPEEPPVDAVPTTEVTDHTVDPDPTPVVATAEVAEEIKKEEESGEAKVEEVKSTEETNGETKEDEAKDDSQKSEEGVAASAEETKA